MGLIELFLVAIGLSMDAFAVSICKGLSMKPANLKKAITVGLYFGGFQAAMPLVGYILGSQFSDHITFIDHWIAFILLAFIGGRMIFESREAGCAIQGGDPSLKFSDMLPLAVATSIDALAIGVSLAFLKVEVLPAVLFIGFVTFFISGAGVLLGGSFGPSLKSRAEIAGGVILILIGCKILFEHLGFLPF